MPLNVAKIGLDFISNTGYKGLARGIATTLLAIFLATGSQPAPVVVCLPLKPSARFLESSAFRKTLFTVPSYWEDLDI